MTTNRQDGGGAAPSQAPILAGWFVFRDGEWRQAAKGAEGAIAFYELPAGVAIPPAPEVTDAMVDAYLKANDAYWKRTDELPTAPGKWRTGTAREATRESLRAALGVARLDGSQR